MAWIDIKPDPIFKLLIRVRDGAAIDGHIWDAAVDQLDFYQQRIKKLETALSEIEDMAEVDLDEAPMLARRALER